MCYKSRCLKRSCLKKEENFPTIAELTSEETL